MKKSQIIISAICYIVFIAMWIGIGFFGFMALTLSNDMMNGSIAVVLVIVALAIVISPFYIKIANPKRAFVSLMLTIIFVITSAAIFQGLTKYYSVFTTSKWINHDKVRHRMIESLENQYTLVGMTEDEIKELLGEPSGVYNDFFVDNENQYYYDYYAGNAVWTTVYYYVTFENGVVVKAWTHHD